MRLLLIGGTGTIGAAVADAFTELGDEVVSASRSGDHSVDIVDRESIDRLFGAVGEIDAVVVAAGKVPSVALADATGEDFDAGFASKLGGQISVVLAALPRLADGGSITLTSGILAQHAVPGSVVTAAVNGALEGFVARAALDLPRGLRINAVSPTIVLEPGETSEAFRGFRSVTAPEVAQAYVRSAYGIETGQVFRVW
ncbi:short chain dehydrogenase [Microbacterium sp. 1.5R]|uniref:short chain dehydrogenase n=1 Tax=Microbacterium sp. 1.5R TaxID=1916917 RepID=UPI0011A2F43E|nr:short chain dehydrogenase [Microbacterium sp. 1.5R]